MLTQQTGNRSKLNFLECDENSLRSMTQRNEIESFISKRFKKQYGADIYNFMPILLSMKDESSRIRAALGLRPASTGPLFLENYLDDSIENTVFNKTGQQVSRSKVIEVGNLAIGDKGSSRSLIIAMSAYLSTRGYEWAVFTIGPILINSFNSLGLSLTELGTAIPEKLSFEERQYWGSYYQQKPKVMIGNLSEAHGFLNRLDTKERTLQNLWHQARRIGRKAA